MNKNYLMGETNNQIKYIIDEYYSNLNKNSEKTAVIYNNRKLIFRDLEVLSNYLVKRIENCDGMRIGVMAERTPNFLACILAIFKVHGVYVPLVPSVPDNRLESMIQQANINVILVQKKFTSRVLKLKNRCNGVKIIYLDKIEYGSDDTDFGENKTTEIKNYLNNNRIIKDREAYILFTSGTSGVPKGVMVTHRGMMNMIKSAYDSWKLCKEDIIIGATQFGFDMSIPELMIPLARGITLLMLDDESYNSPKKMLKQINLNNATVFQTTPSRFRQLMIIPDSYEMLHSINKLILGGEIIDNTIIKYVKCNMKCEFFNTYGLTETSVFSTVKKIIDKVSLGFPIYNTEIYILDKELNILPENEKGEICISGVGLGRYLEQNYNEKHFVEILSGKKEVFLTGDFGYVYKNELYYSGRNDNQIKLNGYRIEIDEIANWVLESGLVFNVVVLTECYADKELEIVAYLIPKKEYNEVELRQYLKLYIPNYMIPHKFVCVPEYPLNHNGKIDYIKLKRISVNNKKNDYKKYTKLEIKLIEIWESILNVSINLYDDFFDVGGDSLKYYIMLSLIMESLNYDLFDITMYEITTIEKLVEFIENKYNVGENYVEENK